MLISVCSPLNQEIKIKLHRKTQWEANESPGNDYEMPLEEFIKMASALDKHDGVMDLRVKTGHVSQKSRGKRKRLSLKESTDKTASNRRRCAYVKFKYDRKNVCLVEIDQEGLPNGCSTFVLVSSGPEVLKGAETIVRWYVESLKQDIMVQRLASKGISLETKRHPSSKSLKDISNWGNTLLEKYLDHAFKLCLQ